MKKYIVEVLRKESASKEIEVEADSPTAAVRIAMALAGDLAGMLGRNIIYLLYL